MILIYITGDTHGEYDRFEEKQLRKLREDDYLIICGDFGFVWDNSEKERAVLEKIGEKRYMTLFVEGTHENFSILNSYPVVKRFGGSCRHICGNLYQLLRGEIYSIDGSSFFTFGGGDSSDKDLRRKKGTWWKEEEPTLSEMKHAVRNLDKAGRKVDYIITHEPSMTDMALMEGRCRVTPLSTFLDEVAKNVSYKDWYFGSLHKNKTVRQAHCLFTELELLEREP